MRNLVIDAHQHYWDLRRFDYPWMAPPELSALRRNFLPEDLKPILQNSGVDRTVVVQAHQSLGESRWLLELASTNEIIAGAVIWVDLTSPKVAKDLDDLQSHPKFKGVRHIIEDEPDDAWMVRKDVLAGFAELERRDIPYDLLVYPRHLKHVQTVRDHCPNLRMVVDHIAKPAIAKKAMDGWAESLANIARLPHTWCKLSGMVTEADWKNWSPEDLKPYVAHVVQQFGCERVMFGSDWPVCTLAGTYQQVVDALRIALGPLHDGDAAKVWGENACTFYQLD
jgi:L-fucono-1,5-lactonase